MTKALRQSIPLDVVSTETWGTFLSEIPKENFLLERPPYAGGRSTNVLPATPSRRIDQYRSEHDWENVPDYDDLSHCYRQKGIPFHFDGKIIYRMQEVYEVKDVFTVQLGPRNIIASARGSIAPTDDPYLAKSLVRAIYGGSTFTDRPISYPQVERTLTGMEFLWDRSQPQICELKITDADIRWATAGRE